MAAITLSLSVEKKSARLTIRLSDATKRELAAAAAQRSRSVAWLAVDIIEKWLRAQRRK